MFIAYLIVHIIRQAQFRGSRTLNIPRLLY
jgi:hypothetical protein